MSLRQHKHQQNKKQVARAKEDDQAREKLNQDPVLNSLLAELNVAEGDVEVSAN